MIGSRVATALTAACLGVALLAACSNDEPNVSSPPTSQGVSSSPSAPATTSPTPSARATTTTTPRPTARPTTAKPSAQPSDDENGELAGQLIIEYPGKPLRRTSSTTPSADVRDFQVRLNEVGYPVATNGVFDLKTERVVKRFQRDNGLEVDGIVGPSTWAALFTFEGASE